MEPNYKSTIAACFVGCYTQAIVVNLAPIFFVIYSEDFGISFSMIGSLILVNFVTQFLTDAACIKLLGVVGYRRACFFAHFMCVCGLILIAVLPQLIEPYAGLIIATIVYAIGGGLLEVTMSPIVDAVPGDAKTAAMSLLHSFYSWGQLTVMLITTLVIFVAGNSCRAWLPLLWAVIPAVNMLVFVKVPMPPMVSEDEKLDLKSLLSSKTLVLAIFLMMGAGVSEIAMSQWASLFAELGLGVPKLLGDLLGPCFFAACMGIGRMLMGIVGAKKQLDFTKILCASAIFTVICYAVTVFVPLPFVGLLGCAFCGFGVALMWPGTISLTSAKCPLGGSAMFAILALAGDSGCSIGPWLTGIISDAVASNTAIQSFAASAGMAAEQVGLKAGLLVVSVFPLGLIFGYLAMRKMDGASKLSQSADVEQG